MKYRQVSSPWLTRIDNSFGWKMVEVWAKAGGGGGGRREMITDDFPVVETGQLVQSGSSPSSLLCFPSCVWSPLSFRVLLGNPLGLKVVVESSIEVASKK